MLNEIDTNNLINGNTDVYRNLPVYFILASNDEIFGPETGRVTIEHFAKRDPNVNLLELPNVGHGDGDWGPADLKSVLSLLNYIEAVNVGAAIPKTKVSIYQNPTTQRNEYLTVQATAIPKKGTFHCAYVNQVGDLMNLAKSRYRAREYTIPSRNYIINLKELETPSRCDNEEHPVSANYAAAFYTVTYAVELQPGNVDKTKDIEVSTPIYVDKLSH